MVRMNLLRRISRRVRQTCTRGADEGMTTAEYAVGTIAAVAFAAVLYKVIRSGAVQSALNAIIKSALNVHLG